MFFFHIFFMNKAIAEAKYAFEKDEVPVGAVIVSNDKIIARAHNLTEMLNDVTAHAEMQAITSAANYLGGKTGSYIDKISEAYGLSNFFLIFFVIPVLAGILMIVLKPHSKMGTYTISQDLWL